LAEHIKKKTKREEREGVILAVLGDGVRGGIHWSHSIA